MKGRMVCIHLTNIWLQREQHWMKELASAMFKPLWLYEQSEMLGLDWQAMLVWMAAGQSYPCLLLYAHCVYCTRIVCIVRACFDSTLLRAALWAYNTQRIGHCLRVPSFAIHLATIRLYCALWGDPSSQKLNFVLWIQMANALQYGRRNERAV